MEVYSGYVPDTVHVDNDTIVYGNSDTLYATGNSIYWWESDTASVELANDTLFVTGSLYDTTTYWVSDRAGAGIMIVQIGTGVITNIASDYPTPYGNYYWGNKEQYLFLASELTAMGISAGPIASLQFDIATVNSCPTLYGYKLKIGQTSVSALSTWISGLTSVFSPGSYTPVVGWNEHLFSTPYVWDGVSNLVVQVCSNNSNYAVNGNASVNSSITTFNSVLNYHGNNLTVCSNTNLSWGFPGTTRPNMKLTVDALGCHGDRTSVTVVVTNFPQLDAALTEIIEPIGTIPAGINTAVKAVIKNFGQVALTSVDIPYSINGVVMDTVTWTGNLAYTQVDTFLLDSVSFPGGSIDLVAYSILPNDTFYTNDTVSVNFLACLSGTYSIGDTTTGAFDYGSFNGAVAALNSAGICSSVVFNVDAGIYNEKVVIEEIIGAGPNATITFQSASGDSTDVILVDSATVSAAKYTVKFDGADYVTFQKMTIKAMGASYGYPVEMESEADNNTIANCELIMNLSTSSYITGVYAVGDNKNITVKNNYIQNGGYSVYISGPSSSNPSTGLLVHGNIIEAIGYYGMYIRYQDSCIITNNTISMGANSNYVYGMYIYYCNHNFEVGNNIINILQGGVSTKYGLNISNCNYYYNVNNGSILGGTGLVYNNSVHIRAGTGIKYGLYASYNEDVKFLYNTIKLSGNSTNARALYQSNSAQSTNGMSFINNSFIDSIGGYAAYFAQTASVNTTDYNNFYSEGGNIAYWTGAKATIADLQAASGYDAHSISENPTFMAADDLHLVSYSLSGMATPITDVTTDVDGKARSTTLPTIGFHERTLLAINIGVTEVINFPDTTSQASIVP
ncbi:MAG: right-handed parallel beta-helix repeat-containing protein, partial [Chlamydiia bacterium]|nr:right-handed parallel beta-helix repeat-containing protein [Chlamydiia bacterium]